MRLPALVTTAALVLALPLGIGGAADAKPKKKADLVVSTVTQTSSTAGVDVSVTVKNKAKKKAKASTVRVTLSADTVASADDRALGAFPVGKLKAKKSATAGGRLVVPSTVPAGSYTVIACADGDGVVKEKKETNNCRAAAGVVVVAAPVPPQPTGITIAYRVATPANPLPTSPAITATTSAGTCTSGPVTTGSCTVPPGAATVVLTASPYNGINYVFQDWIGADGKACDGNKLVTPGAAPQITFTNATAAKSCIANYTFAA